MKYARRAILLLLLPSSSWFRSKFLDPEPDRIINGTHTIGKNVQDILKIFEITNVEMTQKLAFLKLLYVFSN